jgi:hypothetical protein
MDDVVQAIARMEEDHHHEEEAGEHNESTNQVRRTLWIHQSGENIIKIHQSGEENIIDPPIR